MGSNLVHLSIYRFAFLQKAAAFEKARAALEVQVQSFVALEDQITRHGLTWLDEQCGERGGERVAAARQARLKCLREQGLLSEGETFHGRYEGAVDLGNRRLAIFGNSKEFALVPWRAEIERHRGREMIARRTEKGVSWTIGMGRDKGLSR